MSSELLERLASETDRLRRSSRPASGGFRQIARGLLLEAGDAGSLSDILVDATSDGEVDPVHDLLRRSLVTARTTAWMTVHFASVQTEAEWTVVAGLLADAGRWRSRRKIADQDDTVHPSVGAALAAGLIDAPASLPRLVARHHERSDGTGFPAGLSATSMSIEDRLLAATTRFAELFAGNVEDTARRLHEEARRGAFDGELTANLVWSVTGELPTDAGFGRPAPRLWPLTDHGRRLRRDDAHSTLHGPHFSLLSNRSRDRQVVIRSSSRSHGFGSDVGPPLSGERGQG